MSGCYAPACHICFNPRVREGRDTCAMASEIGVSGFNPRVREGRDPRLAASARRVNLFQSTRP